MRLNDELPWLPEWPDMLQDKKGVEVTGEHLSYAGRKATRIAVGVVIFVCLPIMCIAMNVPDDDEVQGKVAGVCMLIGLAYSIIGPSRILQQFFTEKTCVRFTTNEVCINGKSYPVTAKLSVQFRAVRSPVPEDEHDKIRRLKQQRPKAIIDDLSYRSIEMIYGARPVFITSVADEHRAEQFAMALQIAYGFSQTGQFQMPTEFSSPDWESRRLPE